MTSHRESAGDVGIGLEEITAPPNWWPHYFALFVVSVATGLLFLHEPGFGDDLTYWSLAFDLHDGTRNVWNLQSFHDLRWPVWGVSWLWQYFFGPGLASFYCVPLLYLAAGSALAFTFGRMALRTAAGGWACGLALLFLPLLDPVISRPMPDLAESVFGASALLAWWAMMQSTSPRRAAVFGLLAGVSIGLSVSNRITGVFIAPVLVVSTLMFFPRRWPWLFVPALGAALFLGAEGAIYYLLRGDPLHNLHANLTARGATDTAAMPVWNLPLRYLDGLFRSSRIASVFAAFALGGLWAGWRHGGLNGRLVAVWFVVLYLECSCAVQSFNPVRPLLGSTVRYLAALSIPMAVLAGIGVTELTRLISRWSWAPARRCTDALARHPVIVGGAAFVALALYSNRPFFDRGFTAELQHRMATMPSGTKIFSHRAMRDVAFLVDPENARRFQWIAPKAILVRNEELEAQAAASDEFWYLRKQLWMSERKNMERTGSGLQPALGSYFDAPAQSWMLTDIFAKGSDCDLVFYRRRPADASPPQVLTPDSPEIRALFPPLPAMWDPQRHPRTLKVQWKVPASLRGKLLNIEFNGASTTVEPFIAKFQFDAGERRVESFLLKPILYAGGGKEFLALPIPADAETCRIEIRFSAKSKDVQLTAFRAVFDDQR